MIIFIPFHSPFHSNHQSIPSTIPFQSPFHSNHHSNHHSIPITIPFQSPFQSPFHSPFHSNHHSIHHSIPITIPFQSPFHSIPFLLVFVVCSIHLLTCCLLMFSKKHRLEHRKETPQALVDRRILRREEETTGESTWAQAGFDWKGTKPCLVGA